MAPYLRKLRNLRVVKSAGVICFHPPSRTIPQEIMLDLLMGFLEIGGRQYMILTRMM